MVDFFLISITKEDLFIVEMYLLVCFELQNTLFIQNHFLLFIFDIEEYNILYYCEFQNTIVNFEFHVIFLGRGSNFSFFVSVFVQVSYLMSKNKIF